MRTDELVAMLAAGAGPVSPGAVRRRFALALGCGALGALLLMIATLGVRPDLATAAALPMFWIKLAFPAALVAGGAFAVSRLARPGAFVAAAPWLLAAPLVAMGSLAAVELAAAAPPQRAALLMGETWQSCPLAIALLSLPALTALLWAMRGLAPTRLALAGGAAGLLAGAVGALVYALHCTEMAAPFLSIWYVAGVLIPAAAAAWLGPRLLRW